MKSRSEAESEAVVLSPKGKKVRPGRKRKARDADRASYTHEGEREGGA